MMNEETKKTEVAPVVVTASMERKGLEMTTDQEQFAMAIKTYRLRHNLTQAQLGKQWGVSRYTILRAERCKTVNWTTTYRLFAMLAEALRKEDKDPTA